MNVLWHRFSLYPFGIGLADQCVTYNVIQVSLLNKTLRKSVCSCCSAPITWTGLLNRLVWLLERGASWIRECFGCSPDVIREQSEMWAQVPKGPAVQMCFELFNKRNFEKSATSVLINYENKFLQTPSSFFNNEMVSPTALI